MSLLARVALLALTLLAALPSSSLAGTVAVSQREEPGDKGGSSPVDVVSYDDPSEASNDLEVRVVSSESEYGGPYGPATAFLHDTAGIELGPGCRRADPSDTQSAICEGLRLPYSPAQDFHATLGPGDDRAVYLSKVMAPSIDAGPGADWVAASGVYISLQGGEGPDTLLGGSVSDILEGGPGDDRLEGGKGPDTLNGGPGRDELYGGDGDDTVSFKGETRRVVVDFSDPSAYGPPEEPDSAPDNDVESAIGGAGNDLLVHGSQLDGGAGDDVLIGTPAGNVLRGGAGRDSLDAGDGNDQLRDPDAGGVLSAGPGDDRISLEPEFGRSLEGAVSGPRSRVYAGSGADTVEGSERGDLIDLGPGADAVEGEGGADVIRARDGQTDRIFCASNLQNDPILPQGTVWVDVRDRVFDCRIVRRPGPSVVLTTLEDAEVHYAVGMGAAIWLECPADIHRCVGTVTLAAAGTRSSVRRFRIRPSGFRSMRVRLSAPLRKRLRDTGCLRLHWSVGTTDSNGRQTRIRATNALVYVRPGDPSPGAPGSRPPC